MYSIEKGFLGWQNSIASLLSINSLQVSVNYHLPVWKKLLEFRNVFSCLQINNDSILIYPNSLEEHHQHILFIRERIKLSSLLFMFLLVHSFSHQSTSSKWKCTWQELCLSSPTEKMKTWSLHLSKPQCLWNEWMNE